MMKRIFTGLVFVVAAILLMFVIAVARGTIARAVEPEEAINVIKSYYGFGKLGDLLK